MNATGVVFRYNPALSPTTRPEVSEPFFNDAPNVPPRQV
jgi:hypothetical protein